MAVTAGAIRETVQIIDMEDEALAYYPGNTSRLKIQAAGDLKIARKTPLNIYNYKLYILY
ncbi:MAG: hypothetical protein ACLTQJ_09595 [[Clostridium] innocuum]